MQHQKGGSPIYKQRDFRDVAKANQWVTLISPDGRDNSIAIKQDAFISITQLDEGKTLPIASTPSNRGKLLLVVEGQIHIGTTLLEARDEIQIVEENTCEVKAVKPSWVLVFDVPMN